MAATDYDALRVRADSEPNDQFLTDLAKRRFDSASGTVDVEDADAALVRESVQASLLVDDERLMPVVPQRSDEFTCSRCFLVVHRTRHARTNGGKAVCRDCA